MITRRTRKYRMISPFIVSVAIAPKWNDDSEKMDRALAGICREDPLLRVQKDPDSGQTILTGVSEIQLAIVADRIVHEYKVELNVSKPKVVYLETIRATAAGEGRYIRQVGGSGNYGHAKIRIEPNEAGKDYEFINEVRDDAIPQKYIESVDHGIRNAMACGVIAGYEMVDIKVTLYDGSYHDLDSNEMAFRIAASMAFKDAARKAKPVLLEPVMDVEVTVPEEFMGAIIADLNSRRGRIDGMEMVNGAQVIHAVVPLSRLFGYPIAVSDLTWGRAAVKMWFKTYEESPGSDPEDEDPTSAIGVPKYPRPRGPFRTASKPDWT